MQITGVELTEKTGGYGRIGAEIALWRAVILRALHDGCGNTGLDSYKSVTVDMRSARHFFDRTFPGYREICHAADVDPEYLEEHAQQCFRIIDKGGYPPIAVRPANRG